MIYFIRTDDPDIDRIKIGYTSSDDAAQRLKDLQTGAPCKLYIMAIMPYGSNAQERALHKTFGDYNVIGEWFDVTDGLLAFIEHFAEPLAGTPEPINEQSDLFQYFPNDIDDNPENYRIEIREYTKSNGEVSRYFNFRRRVSITDPVTGKRIVPYFKGGMLS